jgi:hypothetical protein
MTSDHADNRGHSMINSESIYHRQMDDRSSARSLFQDPNTLLSENISVLVQ